MLYKISIFQHFLTYKCFFGYHFFFRYLLLAPTWPFVENLEAQGVRSQSDPGRLWPQQVFILRAASQWMGLHADHSQGT